MKDEQRNWKGEANTRMAILAALLNGDLADAVAVVVLPRKSDGKECMVIVMVREDEKEIEHIPMAVLLDNDLADEFDPSPLSDHVRTDETDSHQIMTREVLDRIKKQDRNN